MRDRQKRLAYLVCTVAVMALGLASRRYGMNLPVFIAEYAGDTLWALMVFLGISFLAPGARVSHRGAIAIALAYAVEGSQLYHAPWIDAVRRTTLGGLVLGSGFVWTDFICYAAGVSIGVVVDYTVGFRKRDDSGRGSTGGRDHGQHAWWVASENDDWSARR